MDFTLLNSYFDHIYIITLERETERQHRIQEVFDGLNFSFFYGVDKKELTIDQLIEEGIYDEAKTISQHRYNKPMNTGQIGCSWSHRLVYEDMVANNYQRILVLEDDVVPCKPGLDIFEQVILELPANWELLYLDCSNNLKRSFASWWITLFLHIKRLLGRLKWSKLCINNCYARKWSANLLKAGMHPGTSAYALTISGAKKLINLQTPISFLSSDLLSYAATNEIVSGFTTPTKTFDKSARASLLPG